MIAWHAYELQNRTEYLDALRTIACFTVVVLHVNALNTYNVDFQSKITLQKLNNSNFVSIGNAGYLYLMENYSCKSGCQRIIEM